MAFTPENTLPLYPYQPTMDNYLNKYTTVPNEVQQIWTWPHIQWQSLHQQCTYCTNPQPDTVCIPCNIHYHKRCRPNHTCPQPIQPQEPIRWPGVLSGWSWYCPLFCLSSVPSGERMLYIYVCCWCQQLRPKGVDHRQLAFLWPSWLRHPLTGLNIRQKYFIWSKSGFVLCAYLCVMLVFVQARCTLHSCCHILK